MPKTRRSRGAGILIVLTQSMAALRLAISGMALADAPDDYIFAASVASFGMLLRDSPYKGDSTYAAVLELAE